MSGREIGPDSPDLHQLKNYLAIIVGFCDLLLGDMTDDDPKRADVQEMRKAGMAALDMLPGIAERMR